MQVKLIAFDIDDTLLNRKKEITPLTKSALLRAQGNGVRLVVASGRLPYAEALDIFSHGGYYMGFNGGAVTNARDELIGKACLDRKYIQPVYDILRPYDVCTMVHRGDSIFSDTKTNQYTQLEIDAVGLPVTPVDDLPAFIDWEIPKFLIGGEPDVLKGLEQELLRALGDEVDIYLSAPWFLEVMPKGVNKGTGLQMICDDAGVDIGETIAFGDSYNDVFMLKTAGFGVAMGNAEDAVKEAADMVTEDCDEDGIAVALKVLGII